MNIKANLKADTGGGCSVCGAVPVVNIVGTYWLCGPCVLERLDTSKCDGCDQQTPRELLRTVQSTSGETTQCDRCRGVTDIQADTSLPQNHLEKELKACAQLCEDIAAEYMDDGQPARDCAAMILARMEKTSGG